MQPKFQRAGGDFGLAKQKKYLVATKVIADYACCYWAEGHSD